jgi:hypothetical protein
MMRESVSPHTYSTFDGETEPPTQQQNRGLVAGVSVAVGIAVGFGLATLTTQPTTINQQPTATVLAVDPPANLKCSAFPKYKALSARPPTWCGYDICPTSSDPTSSCSAGTREAHDAQQILDQGCKQHNVMDKATGKPYCQTAKSQLYTNDQWYCANNYDPERCMVKIFL